MTIAEERADLEWTADKFGLSVVRRARAWVIKDARGDVFGPADDFDGREWLEGLEAAADSITSDLRLGELADEDVRTLLDAFIKYGAPLAAHIRQEFPDPAPARGRRRG